MLNYLIQAAIQIQLMVQMVMEDVFQVILVVM